MTLADQLENLHRRLVELGVPEGRCTVELRFGDDGRLRRVVCEHWSWPRRVVFGRRELEVPVAVENGGRQAA